jgi:dTDP-glucose 4,6-dehydratase
VRAYFETFGLPVTITNCSNNYRPRQFPEKVIPLFLTNAFDDRELPLYASTQHRREWLHVDDHCRAIETVLQRGREGDVQRRLRRRAVDRRDRRPRARPDRQAASLKTIVPDRPGRPSLPARLLEAAPRARLGATGLVRGRLRATADWYAANRAWWEPLKQRAPVRENAWS